MARIIWKPAGCYTGSINLRSGDRVDGVHRGSGVHYPRELHELADILLHAEIRSALVAPEWVRFVIVPVPKCRPIDSRFYGFLGGISFLAGVDFSQTVASCCLYRECPR